MRASGGRSGRTDGPLHGIRVDRSWPAVEHPLYKKGIIKPPSALPHVGGANLMVCWPLKQSAAVYRRRTQ